MNSLKNVFLGSLSHTLTLNALVFTKLRGKHYKNYYQDMALHLIYSVPGGFRKCVPNLGNNNKWAVLLSKLKTEIQIYILKQGIF